jgi:hypothetical protein
LFSEALKGSANYIMEPGIKCWSESGQNGYLLCGGRCADGHMKDEAE